MAEEFGGSIILAIIATIIALILGIIGLFLNLNWLSFPIAVAIVGLALGLMSDDFLSAGIAGAITGFLTAFLKGFVISIIWGGFAASILNNAIGGQYLLLIFVGAIFAAGSSMILKGN
ncbi:hypothetical protein [uncultured Methanobrevibacter sp.]|uniref:hypothetical protein n=1 Tax=uncultured Methanobrevibacter sp. TaxID=253161 RepID=UPI0025F2D335|nr:hypothetical protein [uncultured Methanobrevibacter sp.]